MGLFLKEVEGSLFSSCLPLRSALAGHDDDVMSACLRALAVP